MGGGRGGVGVLSNFCASAPHSHSFSSLLTTSCSWSMTHLCIIIRNSWEKEMYQFKGNPGLPKWKNPWAKYDKKSLPCSPSSLPAATFAFPAWAKFQSKHHYQCGETSPKGLCVCWGGQEVIIHYYRWRLVCRCVWLSAGLWVWVCAVVCLCTRELFCLSWGMLCVSAPRRGHCSAGCCWKCLCLCVFGSVSVCVRACVCVYLLPKPLGVCKKRHGRETILSGGNSPQERVWCT